MKNASDAEMLISVATELSTINAALTGLVSGVRGIFHGPVLDSVIDRMSEESSAARKKTIELTAEVYARATADRGGLISEDLLVATSDDLVTRLLELASRLLAGNAPGEVASQTHQEAARAAIKGPVVAKVGGGFRVAPIGVAVERAMAEAGIPGRVVGSRITVDRGVVEWESPVGGGIVVRWWPEGR